jgi:hypothetical protein
MLSLVVTKPWGFCTGHNLVINKINSTVYFSDVTLCGQTNINHRLEEHGISIFRDEK